MKTYKYYSELKKPRWSPPAWLFGPVWSVLYTIIFFTFGYVGYMYFEGQIYFPILLPFLLNLLFNFLFTPIQFGLRNNWLASLDILLTLSTLLWAINFIWPYAPLVSYLNIPYLLWVSFATVLQLTITWMNR